MTPADLQALPAESADYRLHYGQNANQFGDLRIPAQPGPHPVVVLVHGGCWKAQYATLRDLAPMGDALKKNGIATWNIEYRRLGQAGAGWPGTYLDVGNAIDHLRRIAPKYNLDLRRIVVVGHSAGGHLAIWSATRQHISPKSPLYLPKPLPIRGIVNLAGTVDMTQNINHMESECKDAVVTGMLGGSPESVPDRYKQVSANVMLPLGIPQVLIWGERDNFIPRPLAEEYVRAAKQAGDRTQLILVPSVGHFETASPTSSAWPIVRNAIRSLLGN
ncbi:MAG TPA: alpha/beta hydrolase [Terriglobales bacterium]|nr:alpha/beta hydrolase [Terriglobales bacterium]